MKITNVSNSDDCSYLFNNIFDEKLKGKTVLQCGARAGRGWRKIFEGFKKHGYDTFHVIEIHEPNVNWLRKQKDFPIDLIVHGDIRKIDTYEDLLPKYDVVIAWHSAPGEHLTIEDNATTIERCAMRTKAGLIIGCPWGKWEQGPIKGNIHERHLSHLYPENFEKWGFDLSVTFNAEDKGPGKDNHNVMFSIRYAK